MFPQSAFQYLRLQRSLEPRLERSNPPRTSRQSRHLTIPLHEARVVLASIFFSLFQVS
jgi:hypothetical protein